MTAAEAIAFHRALPGYRPTPLHDVWGFGDVRTMAALSVAVVAVFAALLLWRRSGRSHDR